MAREPDSFNVSTCPRRTVVENSSPSRTTHSAAVAPPLIARLTTSVAREASSASSWSLLGSRVVVISIKLEVRSQIEVVKVVKLKSKVRLKKQIEEAGRKLLRLLQSDSLLLTYF